MWSTERTLANTLLAKCLGSRVEGWHDEFGGKQTSVGESSGWAETGSGNGCFARCTIGAQVGCLWVCYGLFAAAVNAAHHKCYRYFVEEVFFIYLLGSAGLVG